MVTQATLCCNPAQADFVRQLLLMQQPGDKMDSVSIVLYLSGAAMAGHLDARHCRLLVDSAVARGGLKRTRANVWKGIALLQVRARACSAAQP